MNDTQMTHTFLPEMVLAMSETNVFPQLFLIVYFLPEYYSTEGENIFTLVMNGLDVLNEKS